MTADEILQAHTPEVRAIAEELRRLIHDTIDDMTERAYPGCTPSASAILAPVTSAASFLLMTRSN